MTRAARSIHELESEARREFAFLETEFGCGLEEGEREAWWRRLAYRADTGSAEIYLDEREDLVSVYFGAAGGDLVPLWAVLYARGERPPDDADIPAWADALRRHGAEGLRGDMSGYSGLDEAYARRSADTERFLASYMDELRRKRETESPIRRALRRVWTRLP